MDEAMKSKQPQRIFKSISEVQQAFLPSVAKEEEATKNEEDLLTISRRLADQAFRRRALVDRPRESVERPD